MSGAYVVQTNSAEAPPGLAALLSAQLVHGGETINHYAEADGTLLGLVSHDHFGKGVFPRFLEAHGLWAVLLGELHACDALERLHKDLSTCTSDVEILAALYRDGKLQEELPALNGAFVLMLWDPKARVLVIANDRYGLYPMYWSNSPKGFCLASRALCSVLAGTVDGGWDAAGLAQLLTIDDLIGDVTLVKGVQTFPQATILTKTGDELMWQRYWQFEYAYPDPLPSSKSIDSLGKQVGEAFRRGIARQCASHAPISVTLSGGLDSRCIAAAAVQEGVTLDSYTWGTPGCYDRVLAKQVAETLGVRHHDCEYDVMKVEARFEEGVRATDGMSNIADFHFLAHLHHMENSCLFLNGFAGDVVLGGTYLRREWMQSPDVNHASRLLFARANGLLHESALGQALSCAEDLAENELPSCRYADLFESLSDLPPAESVHRFVLENRQRRRTAMGTVLMRCAAESAACFFDYDFMDLVTSIPAPLRYNHHLYAAMMRHTFPEVCRIRWQTTLLPPLAPAWAIFGMKVLFKLSRMAKARTGLPFLTRNMAPADFAQWFRSPLRSWMEDLVTAPDPLADDVLKPEFCARIWKEHLEGHDHTRLLGNITAIREFSRLLGQARARKPATDSQPVKVAAP